MISTFTQDSGRARHQRPVDCVDRPVKRPFARASLVLLRMLQANVTREFVAYPGLDDVTDLLDAEYDVIIDRTGQQSRTRARSGGEHSAADSRCHCDGLFDAGRSGDAGPLHAGGRARVPHCSRSSPARSPKLWCGQLFAAPPLVAKKTAGKLLVFASAKGGSGVTTVASNFAVSLAQESGRARC